MADRPSRVGIIGCGKISDIYIEGCRRFEALELVAVADLMVDRAREKAAEHRIPKAGTVAELLADPDIDLAINLTIPDVHAEVSAAALEAGKSVYSEKPLATERDDGRRLLELAGARGLELGCAPDTFLGAGLQTCREVVDRGLIGEPVAATAVFVSRGPESWHPNPGFYYLPGAGPLFDMGPYYLTALINLLGPIRAVAGTAAVGFPERLITSQPLAGTVIEVKTPTHVTGLLEFASGATASLLTSFDVTASRLPRIEIYGSEGTLSVPDPNTFGGPVQIGRHGGEWEEVPLRNGYPDNSRGLGAADLAQALRSGRRPRASGELAFHVLDAMQSILEAAQARRTLELGSTCERPAPLPADLPDGVLDA